MSKKPITEAEIKAAQKAWGDGLVAIATAHDKGEEYGPVAQNVLDTIYGYKDGVVLFKPTLASKVPYRFVEADAASYFIGGHIDEDGGFALKSWVKVVFEDDGKCILNGDTALWMGSVSITNSKGEVTRVHKTMGYYRDDKGDVRLQLHHSSVPFSS